MMTPRALILPACLFSAIALPSCNDADETRATNPPQAKSPPPDSSPTDSPPRQSNPAEPSPAEAPPAKAFTDADRAMAVGYFVTCATCHGQTGKGDGLVGKALKPAPRDWTDKAWQASIDDEKIGKIIVEGGAKHGLSPLMAPRPDLASQPGVVAALIEKVRSFGK